MPKKNQIDPALPSVPKSMKQIENLAKGIAHVQSDAEPQAARNSISAATALSRWQNYSATKRKINMKRAAESVGSLKTGGPHLHCPSTNDENENNRNLLQFFVTKSMSCDPRETIDIDYLHNLLTKADVNCKDDNGQTCLHESARVWHIDIAKFLIENGAQVNIQDSNGATPLHVAAASDHAEMITFLLSREADPNITTFDEHQTPVHFAARTDSINSLRALIDENAEFNEIFDAKHRTPLQLAAELDRSLAAQFLLDCGASVKRFDCFNQPSIVPLIANMPTVASDALDQLHERSRMFRQQCLYLNFLQPNTLSNFEDTSDEPGIKSLLFKTRAEYAPRAFPKSALEVCTQCRQYDLVTHPLMKELINVKWRQFGRRKACQSLLFNVLFTILWTALAVYPDYPLRYKYDMDSFIDVCRVVIGAVGVLLTLGQFFNEIKEIIRSTNKYNRWRAWKMSVYDNDIENCVKHGWEEEKKFLERQKKILSETSPSYWRDYWNLFDWLCYILIAVSVAIHFVDVFTFAITQKQEEYAARIHIRASAVTVVLLWIRLLKSARAFHHLGPFIVMLGRVFGDILRFAFLYGVFYVPFCCSFWMIYGGSKPLSSNTQNTNKSLQDREQISISGFKTVPSLLLTLFRLTLVDEYELAEMMSVDDTMTYILLFTWFFVSAILCLNLFIALLSDTFQRVYDNAQKHALMQKAIIILNIEDGLSFESRKKYHDVIREQHCPLKLYYDDDDVTGTENLTKVTLQIKADLNDIKDRLNLNSLDYSEDLIETSRPSSRLGFVRDDSPHDRSMTKQMARYVADFNERLKTVESLHEDVNEIKTMLNRIAGGNFNGLNHANGFYPSVTLPITPIHGQDFGGSLIRPGIFPNIDTNVVNLTSSAPISNQSPSRSRRSRAARRPVRQPPNLSHRSHSEGSDEATASHKMKTEMPRSGIGFRSEELSPRSSIKGSVRTRTKDDLIAARQHP